MDIDILTNPTSEDIEFIKSGLKVFNKDFGTEDFISTVCIVAKDYLGNSLGGAMCNIQYTSCYIHLFWVEAGSRGKGLGARA